MSEQSEPRTRVVSVVLDDGVRLQPVAEGEINVDNDERQIFTDLAALLRQAAATLEAERDREFPGEAS